MKTKSKLMRHLHPDTQKADAGSARYCCCGIGKATIGGSPVFTTWGRNLTKIQQADAIENTMFLPVWIGADDGCAELILPDNLVESLIPSMILAQ